MAEFLGIVKLGTFYHNGSALSLPIRPWYTNSYPGSLSARGIGDVSSFVGNMGDWVIGDTNSNEDKKLKWVKIKDGDKTLLICDRNILNSVSWDTLNAAGYITGKKITIDGQEYLCRVLAGGDNYRSGSDNYSGGQPTNEWDRFIANEDNISGLPKPTTEDLDSTLNYEDLDRAHNQLWNWWGNYSWCKETYKENSSYRVLRGRSSARFFDYHGRYYTCNDYGWRPVLEVLNSAPLISDSDRNLGDYTAPVNQSYTVSDNEKDTVTIVEKLDGNTIRTLNSQPSGQTYIFDLISNWNALKTGIHTMVIEASDNKGAKSVRTWTFNKTSIQIKLQAKTPGTSGNNIKLETTSTNIQISPMIGGHDSFETLVMKEQKFETFKNMDMQVVVGGINKATVKEKVDNSNNINIIKADRQITTGDKLFINNKAEEIIDVKGLAVTHEVKDATVIDQPYSTTGNGGRKLVRLSNGWLVASVADTVNVYLYVSKDDGQTWTLNGNYNLTVTKDFANVSYNNTIYTLANNGSSAIRVYSNNFNTGKGVGFTIDTDQIGIQTCSLTINPQGTELHACWCSKNSAYPNSFNIRYAKGTIQADGTVDWGNVEQITKATNDAGYFIDSSIILDSNNYVHILVHRYFSQDRLVDLTNNPSVTSDMGSEYLANSWKGKFVVEDSHTLSSPTTVFVPPAISGLPQGRIWVAWYALSEAIPKMFNIFVAYSDNGGVTWSTPLNLTNDTQNDQVYPSITADRTGKIFVVWRGIDSNVPSAGDIRMRSYIDNSWGEIETITKNPSSKQRHNHPSVLVDLTLDYTVPLFVYQDGANKRVGFYGTWKDGSGYNITIKNPVIVQQGEQIPLVDFDVQQEGKQLILTSMDRNRLNYTISDLDTTTASISITGKDNTIESIAYAIG